VGVTEVREIFGTKAANKIAGFAGYREAPDKATIKDTGKAVALEEFYAYAPDRSFIFRPSRDHWPAKSVDDNLPPIPVVDASSNPVIDEDGEQVMQAASAWLARNRSVQQVTWMPGEPELIRDRIITEGGWIEHRGACVFNLYRAPLLQLGDAAKAGPWLDHLRKIYPDDADHIIWWCACRVQKPQMKINHALLLGGPTRIGKDTMLEPVRRAVGIWNCRDVSPKQLLGRFNGFLKSVILRVNEVHDLGEFNRYDLYEHCKWIMASPPETLRVDEKNRHEYEIPNLVGLIITTNNRDAIYLPPDDARHYVGWSPCTLADFETGYFDKLWWWYENGGFNHAAAYLTAYDISKFNPKSPPPKTEAWQSMVDAGRAPEESEFADALDEIGNPDAFTLAQIRDYAIKYDLDFLKWLDDRKNRRIIPLRIEKCGYAPVRNDTAKDGMWKIGIRRVAIYAKAELSEADRLRAANELINREKKAAEDHALEEAYAEAEAEERLREQQREQERRKAGTRQRADTGEWVS
jgi:uncharacterized protein DUF5906